MQLRRAGTDRRTAIHALNASRASRQRDRCTSRTRPRRRKRSVSPSATHASGARPAGRQASISPVSELWAAWPELGGQVAGIVGTGAGSLGHASFLSVFLSHLSYVSINILSFSYYPCFLNFLVYLSNFIFFLLPMLSYLSCLSIYLSPPSTYQFCVTRVCGWTAMRQGPLFDRSAQSKQKVLRFHCRSFTSVRSLPGHHRAPNTHRHTHIHARARTRTRAHTHARMYMSAASLRDARSALAHDRNPWLISPW
jgi:hypothetical protein